MNFKFAFKVHSNIFANGTRDLIEMEGLVKVRVAYNTLAFKFEYEESPVWKYIPSTALITGWNSVSLDGDGTYIKLTVNGHIYDASLHNIIKSTISVTNFGNGSIKIPWQNPTTSLDLVIHAKTPTSYSSSGNNALCEAGYDTGTCIAFQIYGYAATIHAWLGSQNSSYDIANDKQVSPSYNTSTDFWIRLMWDGSTYHFYRKVNGAWSEYTTSDSSLPLYSPNTFFSLGRYFSIDRTDNWRDGYIYLCDCYLNVDGNYLFNGATATAADYEIAGSPTITGYNSYEQTYPDVIKTGNLITSQSWDYLKDIQALKLEDTTSN